MILYATVNLLAGSDVTLTSLSEDSLYVLENLYNARPSKPFRTTGIGAVGTPQWIMAEFDAAKLVTLVGLFNHNILQTAAGDILRLLADDAPLDWNSPDYNLNLASKIVQNWNDLYSTLNQTRLAWRLEIIDQNNADGYIEIGEWLLGQYTALSNSRLLPGRQESPHFFRFDNRTPYGQHWIGALSKTISIDLTITNIQNAAVVNEVRLMLEAIHEAGNRVFLIPNHNSPYIYYANLETDNGFMEEIIRGPSYAATSWTMTFQALTKGIRLL